MSKRRVLITLARVALFLRLARASNVTWDSPSAGDVYGPGDTLEGKWTTNHALSSPSFRLCSQGTDSEDDTSDPDCGDAIWPTVKQADDDSYSMSLVIPNVTTQDSYFLQLKDDLGTVLHSPTFVLKPTNADEVDPASSSDGPANATPLPSPTAQAPSDDPSGPQDIHPPAQSASPVSPPPPPPPNAGPNNQPPQAPFTYQPPPMQPTATPTRDTSNNFNPHSYAPTAAIAVPLALVGTTLLTSLGLFLHHRRALAQHIADQSKDSLSRQSSLRTNAEKEDLEKAAAASVPAYMVNYSHLQHGHGHGLGYGAAGYGPVSSLSYAHPGQFQTMLQTREDVRREYVPVYPSVASASPALRTTPAIRINSKPLSKSSPELERNLFFQKHPDSLSPGYVSQSRFQASESDAITHSVLSSYLTASPMNSPGLPQPPATSYTRSIVPTASLPDPYSTSHMYSSR